MVPDRAASDSAADAPPAAAVPAPDSSAAPEPPGDSRLTLVVLCVMVLLIGAGWGGYWYLARDPAWAAAARSAYRVRQSVAAEPEDLGMRSRYAFDLLTLATRSPQPLRAFVDWRADAQCAVVRKHSPPGTFGSCRQLHLDRLLQRGDGERLVATALAELDGAPHTWIAPLHRFAARGGVLSRDWVVARDHFGAAFQTGGEARDALLAGWCCLYTGEPQQALRWLQTAYVFNRGYPPALRGAARMFPFDPDERRAIMLALDREAKFYRDCRAAAQAMLRGESADIPPHPPYWSEM